MQRKKSCGKGAIELVMNDADAILQFSEVRDVVESLTPRAPGDGGAMLIGRLGSVVQNDISKV